MQASRVLQKAVQKGLISDKESKTIVSKTADGTIEISEYNERVQEVIKSYQTWADKARESRNAIEELHQNIRQYINDLKKMRDAQRSATLDQIKNGVSLATGGLNNSSSIANNQLKYNNTAAGWRNQAYEKEVTSLSNDVAKIASGTFSGTITKQLAWKNLSKIKNQSSRKAYADALRKAASYLWSKKAVPWNILNTIKKFSSDTYNRLITYNLAVAKYEEAKLESALNYTENSAEIYENLAKIYDNRDKEINDDISLLEAQSNNEATASKKNGYLTKAANKYNSIINNDNNRVNEFKKLQRSNAKTISKQSGLTGNIKFLSAGELKKCQDTVNAAKNAAKKGEFISSGTLRALAQYYSKGYISSAFYQACVDYNNALDSKNQAIDQRALDRETAKQRKIAIGQEKINNIQEEKQRTRSSIDAKTSLIQSQQNTKTTRGLRLNANDYKALIRQNKQQKELYEQEAKALESTIKSNLNRGLWTKATPEYKEAIIALKEIDSKIEDCATNQEEWNNAIAQIPYDTIEARLELLDAIADFDKTYAERKSAKGRDLSESDYIKQIENNNALIRKYRSERAQAYDDYLKAMASKNKVYGGKTADQYLTMYNSIGATINGLRVSNEDLKNSLRDDVYWRTFERAHEKAKRLANVLEGISDLIDEDMYFDKDGNLTRFGMAQIANLTKQYENARTEVKNYTKDIDNLNKLYKTGQYTSEEYKEKLAELQEGILGAAGDMKGLFDDIKEIYQDMDQAELDSLYKLIDARSEALNQKKAYYDYDKQIRGKTKDVQELEAQLAALEGINTAEAKAKSAKLREQLSKAQEDLEDTRRNHELQLSQDALSDLKGTLQDEFDEKWDKLELDLTQVKDLLKSAETLASANAKSINQTLNSFLSAFGIDSKKTGVNKAFATGTKRVPSSLVGLSNEKGSELLVTKNGIISHFNPGDGVVPHELTQRLFELAQSAKPGASIGNSKFIAKPGNMSATVNQSYGSLINIEGNADSVTISELKKFSKQFLEQSYDYTSKRIKQDYVKTGGLRRA